MRITKPSCWVNGPYRMESMTLALSVPLSNLSSSQASSSCKKRSSSLTSGFVQKPWIMQAWEVWSVNCEGCGLLALHTGHCVLSCAVPSTPERCAVSSGTATADIDICHGRGMAQSGSQREKLCTVCAHLLGLSFWIKG